jgi:NAD(P)-dependent dehydrogenase (short-subunit alcohol dehydrogenase family)
MGEAAARLFVAEGARVVLGDVQVDKLEAVAASLGDAAAAVRCDVTSSHDLRSLVATAAERFGHLDVMYNNAGGGRRSPDGEFTAVARRGPHPEQQQRLAPVRLADVADDDWDDTVAVNLRAVFLGMKHAIPLLINNGGGSIITTASVSAFLGIPGQAAYGAAKGGVVQLTRVCAIEYADVGIRCNCICPGGTATPLIAPGGEEALAAAREMLKSAQPIRRAGLPEDVAQAALWLASDESSFVTGQAIVVDGGWMASARISMRPSPT